MPDVSGPGGSTPSTHPQLPSTAGLDGFEYRTVAEAALERESAAAHRVGWGFISLYTLAFISTSLLFLAPLLVTFLVQLTGNRLAMFLAPCAIGGLFVLLFAARLNDRRLAKADKPTWSLRELASTFYFNPRRNPDFAWAFASRFMFVLAYAFLTTYQAYYLLDKIGSAEADVPRQIFLGTLAQSAVVVASSLIGGKLSDLAGRRKIFVLTASIVYGLAMFVLAIASNFNGFLLGMAIGGLGFGVYTAVDLALVVDVLPDNDNAAKDLGVMNIAGALPFSVAPGIAPAILAFGNGSYGVLYAVAGVWAIIGAVAILPVKGVR